MENRVLGHCKLLSKLGEGGMGVVWRARHETLQKDVAVKVLPPGYAAEPEAIQRFLREARSAARLEHPNVVQVLDAGSADGVHFIVMQFVDGADLAQIIKKRGKLAVGDALAIAKRVAVALGAAHKLGLVHRDIKPANILITKQSRVMVADFGLAREVEGGGGITTGQEIIGTPQYLAPEQVQGERTDGRSDLYSLGCTLYCMLTGRVPFDGKTALSIAMKHADPKERPAPIRSLAPDVPGEVEALVEKLMAKKPADRFQTAEEVAAAIDRVKSGSPATLVTVREDRVLTPKRRRRLILVGVGSALAGLFLLIFLLVLVGPSEAEKAYRSAAAVRTDEEKVLLLIEVKQKFRETEWAGKAAAHLLSMMQRDLGAIQAASRDGKTPFREVIVRVDSARRKFPESSKAIDDFETQLHKHRLAARTRDFGEALVAHRPAEGERSLDRLKGFAAPESLRKISEGGMRFWMGVMLGIFTGLGGKVEETEVFAERVTVENRQAGIVPARAVVHNRQSNERVTQNLTIHWVWQEGDWYLAEKAIHVENK